MDQRGGLKGMAGGFMRHFVTGKFSQFVVNRGEKFTGGLGIAFLNRVQDARDFAHEAILTGMHGLEKQDQNLLPLLPGRRGPG